ncbi:beta-glucoside-specific PTS transporter subunit IIABC [Salinicoccus carnicancri]|uniref:beta-glucoside-specific PTS transporter subunit IIABC n=1 Tax=Salinicoccus carnicancri TaxID=558170 RepID=UPI0002D3FF0E|nr:beta-glucoside-specific PTS transporter subunit IIABC [Salinicoccus carnicancri]
MKYEELSKFIVENVGGKENIDSLTHCITRLRFKLKDEDKANTDMLKNNDEIVTVMQSGGQYQVVIGNHVPDVYKAVTNTANISEGDNSQNDGSGDGKKGSVFNTLIDIISGIFQPILGVLAATGMIKGLTAMILAFGWVTEEDGLYILLNATGDAFFHFLPIFLGYAAAKKFNVIPFVGMGIGAALTYPAIAEVMEGEALYTIFGGTIFETPIYIELFGIPIILMSYATSVVPIILAVYFASYIEKFARKVIPDVVKLFLVPFFTMLIVVPLTFMVIGPISTWISQIIGSGASGIYEMSPILMGVLVAGLWQALVIFGLHWGLVPIGLNNIATGGFDPILAAAAIPSFGQIGAVLAVMLKTRNEKLKTLSIPAFISGVFGVTEPAIYGVTLPKKWPFIWGCVASAAGGGIIGLAGAGFYMLGGLGIFSYPSFIGPEGIGFPVVMAVLATIITFVLAFVIVYFTYKEGTAAAPQTINQENVSTGNVQAAEVSAPALNENDVMSPMDGRMIQLKDVEDQVFASESMGKGIAIEPELGEAVAPFNGEVVTVFPTGHAAGLKSDSGIEILIHIGLDTVQLQGQHYEILVKDGQRVKIGDPLIKFDIESIKEAGYSTVTPIIVTNSADFPDIGFNDADHIKQEELIMTVERGDDQ